jgi:hypothetical protein
MSITLNPTGLTATQLSLGVSAARPATSARAILAENPSAPSGFYWISWPNVLGGYPLETYCDMTGSESGSSVGGWMRLDNAWHESHRPLYQYQSPQGSGVFTGTRLVNWVQGFWQPLSFPNLLRRWDAAATDGTIRAVRWSLPSGSRGIRVKRLRVYSIGGADYPSYNDSTSSTPSVAQIVSAGDGNVVSLGSNVTSFGVYFGNSTIGVRPYKTSAGDYPISSEAPYGGYVELTANSFNQFDDIGSDADRIIWFESDGDSEREQLHQWTFWIR